MGIMTEDAASIRGGRVHPLSFGVTGRVVAEKTEPGTLFDELALLLRVFLGMNVLVAVVAPHGHGGVGYGCGGFVRMAITTGHFRGHGEQREEWFAHRHRDQEHQQPEEFGHSEPYGRK